MIAGTLRSELPSRTEFKTHDLLQLSETALLPESGTAGAGRLLLRDDEILASLLATLNDFARDGRDLYMDGVLNPGRHTPEAGSQAQPATDDTGRGANHHFAAKVSHPRIG
jgi:hypothetical protein